MRGRVSTDRQVRACPNQNSTACGVKWRRRSSPPPFLQTHTKGTPLGRKAGRHTRQGGQVAVGSPISFLRVWLLLLLTCGEGEDGGVLHSHHGEELLDKARGLGRGVGGGGFLAAAAAAAHGPVVGLHGLGRRQVASSRSSAEAGGGRRGCSWGGLAGTKRCRRTRAQEHLVCGSGGGACEVRVSGGRTKLTCPTSFQQEAFGVFAAARKPKRVRTPLLSASSLSRL